MYGCFSLRKLKKLKLKEDIDISKLNNKTQEELGEYDKLFGVKYENVVCYDSIIFDSNHNLLIMQLDLASLFSVKDLEFYQLELEKLFEKITTYFGIKNIHL